MSFTRLHNEASAWLGQRSARLVTGLCLAASLAGPFAMAPVAFAQAPAVGSAAKSSGAAAAAPTGAAKAAKPASTLLDINTASLAQLDALKGIGEKRAADIVKGRPYKGKDELVQKKIIPQGVYEGIKDQIIAKQK